MSFGMTESYVGLDIRSEKSSQMAGFSQANVRELFGLASGVKVAGLIQTSGKSTAFSSLWNMLRKTLGFCWGLSRG
jgi:hypothetical protein